MGGVYGQVFSLHKGQRMKAVLSKFMKDESGQGLVEYALIIALVAIGLIAILVLFRNAIGNVFNESKNRLNNAPSGSYGA
jgi:pilus assembly protein Flp/PilA